MKFILVIMGPFSGHFWAILGLFLGYFKPFLISLESVGDHFQFDSWAIFLTNFRVILNPIEFQPCSASLTTAPTPSCSRTPPRPTRPHFRQECRRPRNQARTLTCPRGCRLCPLYTCLPRVTPCRRSCLCPTRESDPSTAAWGEDEFNC